MNVLKLSRKYPQFKQEEILRLQDVFNRLDTDSKGYIDEATALQGGEQVESKPYDVVRAALKNVQLDSSRRVELEDFVDVRWHFPLLQLYLALIKTLHCSSSLNSAYLMVPGLLQLLKAQLLPCLAMGDRLLDKSRWKARGEVAQRFILSTRMSEPSLQGISMLVSLAIQILDTDYPFLHILFRYVKAYSLMI